MGAPHGWCPCLTQTERKFAFDNFYKIEEQRRVTTERDLLASREADRDMLPLHNDSIAEPVPNVNHTYCQVCNENYESYIDHVKHSESHQRRSQMQTNYFKDIDSLFNELEQEEAWKTNWKTDPLKP